MTISISSDYDTMTTTSAPNIKVSNPENYRVYAAKDIMKKSGMSYDGDTKSWSGTVEQAQEALEVVEDNIDTLEWYIEGAASTNRTDQCRAHLASLRAVRVLLADAIESNETETAAPSQPAPNSMESTMPDTFGTLHNYRTGEAIRPATRDELLESREAANTDGGAGVIEVGGIACYVEGGDDFIAATDYLYEVEEEAWQRTCGNQSREEFATFTIEQGQAIEDAWTEAVAHAESL